MNDKIQYQREEKEKKQRIHDSHLREKQRRQEE
jgi:hypothetical protein